MKKRYVNHIVVLILLVISIVTLPKLIVKGGFGYIFLSVLILILFFNVVVRSMYPFKAYFLSKWNVLSSKFSKEFEIDIPKELAFDKIKEVIGESRFKLKYANETDFEIFAISKFSWRSWGENIYIRLIDSGSSTIVKFESAALFQVYTWGKNENNFEEFLQKLDDSLII